MEIPSLLEESKVKLKDKEVIVSGPLSDIITNLLNEVYSNNEIIDDKKETVSLEGIDVDTNFARNLVSDIKLASSNKPFKIITLQRSTLSLKDIYKLREYAVSNESFSVIVNNDIKDETYDKMNNNRICDIISIAQEHHSKCYYTRIG